MFVALFHHGFVEDLLLQVATGEFDGGFAASRAQRIGVAAARQGFFTGGGEAVAQFFPRVRAGALGQCAMQEFLCLWPLALLAGQVRQALQNIVDVLKEGGAKPEHIVRMTWYVTDKKEYVAAYPEIGKAFRELIGSFNAVMTAVEVAALIEDQAKVEIEVTAVIPE